MKQPSVAKETKATPEVSSVRVPMRVTIPTGQYANIQPEVEGIGRNFEEAQADALRKAASFYEVVEAQAGLKLNLPTGPVISNPADNDRNKIMKCWASGTEVFYDDVAHKYVDAQGVPYISGSKFASTYEPEFPKEAILPGYAERYGVKEYEVDEMWQGKADMSTTFGTALHQALETFGKHWRTAKACGKDPMDMIHPTLRPAVADFFTEERMNNDAVYEMFIADPDKHRCGQLDLVTIVDREKRILDIEDYKTNAELFKVNSPKTLLPPFSHLPNMSAAKYTLQLSFYKAIFEKHGWTVRALKLHHWTGLSQPGEDAKWEEVVLRPENIEVTAPAPIDLSSIR